MALSAANFGDHRVLGDCAGAESSQKPLVEIKGICIDDLFIEHANRLDPAAIDLLWVDVQGYEGFVFQGAKGLVGKGIPVVSEIWPYGLRKAEMSVDTFCGIAAGFWPRFWETGSAPFKEHSIDELPAFMDRFQGEEAFDNVVFVP